MSKYPYLLVAGDDEQSAYAAARIERNVDRQSFLRRYRGATIRELPMGSDLRRLFDEHTAKRQAREAAPELLSSLKEMLEAYWGNGDGDQPPTFIARASAAIAKAEGRA